MSPAGAQRSTGAIALSVLLALALSVVPLPAPLELARPAWLPMVVVYWILRRPSSFGPFTAWTCGLMLDALQGTYLGQHALATLLVCALAPRLRLRMRVAPVSHQAFSVTFLVIVYEFVLMWIDGVAGVPTGGALRFAGAASALVVWPLLVFVGSAQPAPAPTD